ncbi:uncharacterized protein [Halyomorpha halys]|uniref:uncharacterized protein n=1 Tax=Halyomorpha halys TaxID=286706 RepID=UPI0034D1917C
MEVEAPGWTRIEYQRPRNMPNPWRRREHGNSRRERAMDQEKRRSLVKPRNKSRREDRKCHGCGKIGHLVAHCPRTRCFECGNEGHIAKQCPYLYQRRDVGRGEPMEINAQQIRRSHRRFSRSSDESTQESGASETEEEVEEPRSRGSLEEKVETRGWKRGEWRRGIGERKTRDI